MFTILGADGKEYGPVTAAKIHEWINGGRANLQTQARRVGEAEWKPLGNFAEFNPSPAAVPGATPPPAFVAPAAAVPQAPTGPVDAKAYADDLINRAAKIDVFGCLSRSFDLWKANLLPLVGVTFVVFLITGILGLIPFLGAVANVVLSGVFYGGLYYYYLGTMRGEPREFGDAFAGFSKAFGPLAIASLLIIALTMAAAFVLLCPWFVVAALASKGGQHMSSATALVVVPGIALCCLPVIYLSISWAFTFVLVIDKGLGPWTAMEVSRRVVTKQWFRVFFTMFLGGILAMLGLIGLIIGVVFTLPLAVGALLYAYEDLCNPPPQVG